LAIAGFEWLVVGGIIVLAFLFRPRIVTDFAKSMGQVVAEFRKGNQDPEITDGDDELLIKTARRLGIKTRGKTSDQISEEILTRADRGQN
jgi:Sec-independent protein translocase protein TatA